MARPPRKKKVTTCEHISKVLAIVLSIALLSLGFYGCSDRPVVSTPPDPPQTTVRIIDCYPGESSSKDSGGTVEGAVGDTDENAKKIFDVMMELGMPKTNIAGILGNFSAESGIDPTSVEGIFDERFEIGSRKKAAMDDPQGYALNTLFPMYSGSVPINRAAYIGNDGKYWPGVGLGGFTGPACTDLLEFSKACGYEWFTMECQLGFMTTDGEGGYGRNGWLLDWVNNEEPSPESAAATFLSSWEGNYLAAGERASAAREWYDKMQSWEPDRSYARKVLAAAGSTSKSGVSTSTSDGKATTTRCDCETTAKDDGGTLDTSKFGSSHSIDIPAEVGSVQTPAAVEVVQPPPDYAWLLGGDERTEVSEPCKSVFEKWKENGGKWKDGLAAIGGAPIVAVPVDILKNAVGDQVFNDLWQGVGVGAVVEIFYSDGHSIVIIVGDAKSSGDATAFFTDDGRHWGHGLGDRVSMIEPWQSQEDYYNNMKPGAAGYHDDMSGTMTKWVVYEKKIQAIDTTSLSTAPAKQASAPAGSTAVEPADASQFMHHESASYQHGDLPSDKVKWIVMHDTESADSADQESVANYWDGANDGAVAAHFIVGRDGSIMQCVPLNQITHHAGGAAAGSNDAFGISEDGRDDMVGAVVSDSYPDYAMNAWSIGIEIMHSQSGEDYTEEQLTALDHLVAYIDQQLGHQPEITDHKEWSGGEGVARVGQGQGKSDCDTRFPLESYKNTRTHDGSGGTEASMYNCPDQKNMAAGKGASGAVAWAIQVANSKTVGYSQADREGVKNFDGKTLYNSDCTSFVWYAWMIGGKSEKVEAASPDWGPATGSFDSYYPKAGFEKHDMNESELQPGDVLWNAGHAALYIGDGRIAHSSIAEDGGIFGKPGDQKQQSAEGEEDNVGEVQITNLSASNFSCYWRYTG